MSNNYNLSFATGSFVILEKDIEVTADAKFKMFDDIDPELTYRITSGNLVGSDTFTGSLERVVGEAVGMYTINQGSIALGANYTINFVSNVFEINKANQTITFGALSDVTIGDANFNLSATASSGLAITYVSSNPAVATVSGNTVMIIGPGTADIVASQTGNTNYTAALSSTRFNSK